MMKVRYLAELRALCRDGYLATHLVALIERRLRERLAEARQFGRQYNWRENGFLIVIEEHDDLHSSEFTLLGRALAETVASTTFFHPKLEVWEVQAACGDAASMTFIIPDATWLQSDVRALLVSR